MRRARAQAHSRRDPAAPIPPLLDLDGSEHSRFPDRAGADSRGARASRSDVSMAETPSGPAAGVYRFYCPLCMLYFKSIHRMSCCEQYVCRFCFADYGQRRGARLPSLENERVVQLPSDVACPCCSASGREIHAERVEQGEPARSYDDSPRTKASMPAIRETLLSPVRVGASFDDMRRKMLSFESAGYRSSSSASPVDAGTSTADTAAAPPAAAELAPGGDGSPRGSGRGVRPAPIDVVATLLGSPARREAPPAAAQPSPRATISPYAMGRIAPVLSPGAAACSGRAPAESDADAPAHADE